MAPKPPISPGEALTTTGQFLTDKAPQIGLNPEAGMAQYLAQVADTIGQTIIQGGLMMGGASAVSRGARAMQRPEPDLTAGLQFDPGVNDALARQALDPSNAQETADVAPPLDATSYQGPGADPAGGTGGSQPPGRPAATAQHLPAEEVGCLYLDAGGNPVTPDPASAAFPALRRHFGSVRGAWPVIRE